MEHREMSIAGLPEGLTINPVWTWISPFISNWAFLWKSPHVTAVRVQLKLPGQSAYDLAVKHWPEERVKSCFEQVSAAGRATTFLDHELLLPELFSCRLKGHGLVSVSKYGGTNLEELLGSDKLLNLVPTAEEQEDFVKQLVAQLLVALHHLETRNSSSGGPQSYRDLKPANIVVNMDSMKAHLIDFGLMMPKDCSNFFSGVSTDHFPVDLAALDPDTDQPYCCNLSGYKKSALAVAATRAGSSDSNMVAITALRILSAFNDTELIPVEWDDHKYKITDEDKASLNRQQLEDLEQTKMAEFAADYWQFMSDQENLSEQLSGTGISAAAVEFLLALSEVDPKKRPSIKEAMHLPWVRSSVREVMTRLRKSRSSYVAEQQQYEQLPVALQEAVEELNLKQQQQREQQQVLQAHEALQAAESDRIFRQQQVEQLQAQVLLLQDQLRMAAAATYDRLQAAEGQLAAVQQLCQQQMQLNDLLQQQLIRHEQQQGVLASTEQQAAAGQHQEQQSDEQQLLQHPVEVQQHKQAAAAVENPADTSLVPPSVHSEECIAVRKLRAAELGRRVCSNGGSSASSSSSDLLAPRTPVCSVGGTDADSWSLTAAALSRNMQVINGAAAATVATAAAALGSKDPSTCIHHVQTLNIPVTSDANKGSIADVTGTVDTPCALTYTACTTTAAAVVECAVHESASTASCMPYRMMQQLGMFAQAVSSWIYLIDG